MNEEELNVKEEEMFLYQILEEHVENDKKHFSPCQECIRLGLQKGFKKGKLEKIKEEIEWLDYILREINIDLTIENLIHIRIKQLQKEIGKEKQDE